MPHCTTKIRTTTNLKTKNNQNCQKIELYGGPTTKELKKKHSSRPVGRAEMGSQGGEHSQQGCSWRTMVGKAVIVDPVRWWLVDQAVPHLRADKLGGKTGEGDRPHNPGYQPGEIKLQNL